jgi:hypothetical protein
VRKESVWSSRTPSISLRSTGLIKVLCSVISLSRQVGTKNPDPANGGTATNRRRCEEGMRPELAQTLKGTSHAEAVGCYSAAADEGSFDV